MAKTNKIMTLDEALEQAVRMPHKIGDLRAYRTSKFATFLQDGHQVKDTMAVVYREGDGQRYGWKSDASLIGDAKHYGYRVIKIAQLHLRSSRSSLLNKKKTSFMG